MKLQRFERLLFDREQLTPEQEAELQQALAKSDDLRRLAASWRSLETQLTTSQQASPEAGFTGRWRMQLQQRRMRRRQRQVGVVLAGSLGGALLALTVLSVTVLASAAGLAAGWMESVIRLSRILEAGIHFVAVLIDGLPAIVGGVVLSLTLAWLSLLWIASLYRFAFQNHPNGGRKT